MIGRIILTKKLIIVIVSIFFISNVSFAVDEGTVQSGAAFNFAAAKKKTPGDDCNKFVRKKRWKIGKNLKKNGQSFYISVGSAAMDQVWGEAGFIDSRQNAYEKAMLNAKQKIAEKFGTQIKRDLVYSLASGKFANPALQKKLDNEQKNEGKSLTDTRDMNSAFAKGMELLNRKLDEELKKTDPPKPVKTKKEAIKKAEELIARTTNFSDAIETVAQTNLYGIIRVFISENGGKGKQSSRCVVALYSDNTQKIADAIKLNDSSMFPDGKRGKNIYDIVGDPDTNEGLSKLFASFGVITKRDDKGDWNVIAYGQSEIMGDDEQALQIAIGEARKMAQGAIRTYVGESVAAKGILEKSENYKALVNNKKKVTNQKSFSEEVTSASKELKITGFEDVFNWSLEATPGANIGVAGTVIKLSFSTMNEGNEEKDKMNNRPTGNSSNGSDRGGKSLSKSNDVDYSKSTGTRSTSGGDTKEDDF